MRSWFSPRASTVGPATEPLDAYKEGRLDERQRVEKDGAGAHASRAEITQAYERGRREERLRHRGSPLMTLLLLILSAGAILMIVLAVRYHSFAGAGAVVDATLQAPVHNAADRAGSALQNAGQSIQERAGSGPH